MQIGTERKDKVVTIAPKRRLDSLTSGDFAEAVNAGFTGEDEKLVIDFTDVDFISSKGLRVLVSVYKELDGRQMEITGANTSVTEVLRLSGLLKVLRVV